MNKIEHIGIAVNDINAAGPIYEALLNTTIYKVEDVPSEHVKTAFLQTGPNKIELLEALSDDSAIAKFIAKKGEGIHHIAFEVDDIRAEMERLKNAGFVLLNDEPKRGADNKLVCFVHPKSAGGFWWSCARRLTRNSSRFIVGIVLVTIENMKPFYLITLLALVFISGCKQQNEKSSEELPPTWNTLTIISEERTVITINNYDDTSDVKIYHTGTIFTPRPKKIKIDTVKAYFTTAEKDTIFKLSKDIVLNPIAIKGKCTDFVGNLEIVIDYRGFRQSGEYSGVCNWNILSDKTLQLHNVLKRKLKTIYLGEHENRISR